MKHTLVIKPAILPVERHKIEDILKELGYEIHGGGTDTDLSSCDITFSREEENAHFLGEGTLDSSASR